MFKTEDEKRLAVFLPIEAWEGDKTSKYFWNGIYTRSSSRERISGDCIRVYFTNTEHFKFIANVDEKDGMFGKFITDLSGCYMELKKTTNINSILKTLPKDEAYTIERTWMAKYPEFSHLMNKDLGTLVLRKEGQGHKWKCFEVWVIMPKNIYPSVLNELNQVMEVTNLAYKNCCKEWEK